MSCAVERCLQFAVGMEQHAMRRSMPRAHAWHRAWASLVVLFDEQGHAASIVVARSNAKTGREDHRTAYTARGASCAEALEALVREVDAEARGVGAAIIQEAPPVTEEPRREYLQTEGVAFPVTLLGANPKEEVN